VIWALPGSWLPRLPTASALAVLLGGLVVTFSGALRLTHSNSAAAALKLQALAARASDDIAHRMSAYEQALRGAEGLIVAVGTESGTSRAFHLYSETQDFSHRLPGAVGIGVLRRGRRATEASGDQRYVVQFFEPQASNGVAPWINAAVDTGLQEAAERSMRTGRAAMSGPTIPPGGRRPHYRMSLILPIDAPAANIDHSRSNDEQWAFSWVFAPLAIDEVLNGLDLGADEISLELRDTSAADAPVFFASPSRTTQVVAGLEMRLPLQVYGRTWEAHVRAQRRLFAALGQRDPLREMMGGVTLSALFACLMFLGVRRNIRRSADTVRRVSIALAAGDASISETLDGIVTEWNRIAEEVFGYATDFAVGRSAASLILPDAGAAEDFAAREAVVGGGTVFPIDTVRQTRDGMLIHVSMAVSALVDAEGRVCGVCRTFRDPSQAIRAERYVRETNATLERKVSERTIALELARNDLRTILDSIPAMISYWDKNLINVFTNRANEAWFGADPGTLPGQHLRALLGEETFSLDLPHIEAAMQGEARSFKQSIAKLTGVGFRHSVTDYIPDVDNGIVRGFFVLVYDVSELTESRLQLAAALRENEELLRTLDLHAEVSITDEKGFITYVNENFCRILGYGRDEVLGRPHSIINSGVQSREFWTRMWDTISTGKPWRGEICNRGKDGELHWVDAIIAPFLGKDGRVQKYVSIGCNITASKATEHKLRSNEAFLERIGTIGGIGGWEFDLGARRVTWSSQTYRILEEDFAYEPQAETKTAFYAPEARPVIESAIAECAEQGVAWDLEVPAATAKGRPIWVRSIGTPEWQDGRVVRVIGAVQDVTARRAIQTQLKDSADRFSIAADSAGIGVWELDSRKDILTWDAWMYRMYGMHKTGAAESHASWLAALHPEDRPRCEAESEAAFRGPNDFNSEFRIIRPSGEVRYIKAASRAERDVNGISVRTIGVNIDVTEARRNEILARRETASLLQTVLDSASEVAIIATDANLMIKVFNSGAERMLGFTSSEMVGQQTLARIHDADEVEAYGTLLGIPVDPLDAKNLRGAAASRSYERTYVHKDGTLIDVALFINTTRSEEGGILGYVCVARDIREQNADKEVLTQGISKAEDANRAKSRFLANMSHEIRTPMNAVMGLSYLLSHTLLTAEQSALLAKIQVASNSLLSVITNILDLSKIEANELLVESTVFSLTDLLRDVADVMAVQAEAKGIEFAMDTPNDLPEALAGDPTRLKQILVNLLSNAIRFTDDGSVRFTTNRHPNASGEIILCFTVVDTGIGISPQEQQKIFAPFAQADTSITRRFGGTGLGLSIVKQLTQMLRGTVGVQSIVGIGSTFTVVLPFQPASRGALTAVQEAAAAPEPGALRGIRVLIVDDSEINLEVAKRILELDGAVVSLAVNGQEAFDRLQAERDAFDVVFMDVQMPILDGYEATRRIRGELGLLSLPIIAVTAGALSSERTRAEDAGMDDFICKPFSGETLAGSILSHVPATTLRSAALRGEAANVSQAAKVPWPDIEGIDAADASARWCGDAALFIAMLSRLFDEFDAIRFPADIEVPEENTRFVRHMHKLRGGACMLGAKTVHALAGQVEAACLGGDFARAAQLCSRLSSEILRLSASAQPVIAAERSRADNLLLPDAVPIAPSLFKELNALLRKQSLAAVDSFRSLSPQLRQCMGQVSYEQVRSHIDNLQFEEASNLLESTQRRLAQAQGRAGDSGERGKLVQNVAPLPSDALAQIAPP
jgi:PAS domain S-box-containing protein